MYETRRKSGTYRGNLDAQVTESSTGACWMLVSDRKQHSTMKRRIHTHNGNPLTADGTALAQRGVDGHATAQHGRGRGAVEAIGDGCDVICRAEDVLLEGAGGVVSRDLAVEADTVTSVEAGSCARSAYEFVWSLSCIVCRKDRAEQTYGTSRTSR